jgi:WD40 repeat protein/predicted Ser/Thr protein kinase
MREQKGQQLGNYRLIRPLGHGGFSEVYLGEHIQLGIEVAIKVLRTQLSSEDVEKFRTEARTLARLKHPHIVRVFDFGVENNIAYLVMDYAPNGTLRQRHPEGTPLPPTIILPYVEQVAAALQYAHEQKFIHRDIKPQNMLLGSNNEVWLSDFGLAKIVQSTISQITQDEAGSPAYMAPEQFLGKPRPASDQYSLGVVIYEWLCGDRPFKGTFTEIYSQHMVASPPPLHEKVPAITRAVEEVVLRALAKDLHQRFASVQAFANALEQACRLEPYLLSASNFDLLPLPQTGPAPGEPLSTRQPAPALKSLDSSGPTAPLPAPLPSAGQPAPAPSASSPDPYPRAIPLSPAPHPLPVPSQSQAWLKRKLSRRTVIVGLIGTAIVVGGGTAALEIVLNGHSGVRAHPPPPPLGTTILTYSLHTDVVKAVAWSPDGKLIASGSLDKTVRVWDASTGKDVLPPHKGHSQGVKTVAWSPNGNYIASGSLDGTVQIWNAATGSPIYTYRGHSPHAVRSVTWSPDSTQIGSGAEDHKVQVWDATTGSNVFSYQHSNIVLAVAWSHDGNYIASGSWSPEHAVQVWNVATQSHVFTYRQHMNDVRALAWSPDSKRIASGSYDQTVQIWDATSGNNVVACRVQSQVEAVAWLPKGQRIVSGSDDNIRVKIWDAANGSLVFPYTAHSSVVWTVAWSPDGTRIASGSGSGDRPSIDHTVRVWHAK